MEERHQEELALIRQELAELKKAYQEELTRLQQELTAIKEAQPKQPSFSAPLVFHEEMDRLYKLLKEEYEECGGWGSGHAEKCVSMSAEEEAPDIFIRYVCKEKEGVYKVGSHGQTKGTEQGELDDDEGEEGTAGLGEKPGTGGDTPTPKTNADIEWLKASIEGCGFGSDDD